MKDRRLPIVQWLKDAVFRSPGVLPPEQRQQLAEGGMDPSEPLAKLAQKVRTYAHRITDEEIAALRQGGFGDDQIFETIISSAVAQGLRQRDLALLALRGGK